MTDDERLKALKDYAEAWTKNKSHDWTCPNCGYCPHCGRGAQMVPMYPQPIYPRPWPGGGWWGIYPPHDWIWNSETVTGTVAAGTSSISGNVTTFQTGQFSYTNGS